VVLLLLLQHASMESSSDDGSFALSKCGRVEGLIEVIDHKIILCLTLSAAGHQSRVAVVVSNFKCESSESLVTDSCVYLNHCYVRFFLLSFDRHHMMQFLFGTG
jgi:hypothetical protein